MIKLKVKKPLAGLKEGEIIEVEADKDGVIIDKFWRRRLRDSARDGCVELVKSTKKPKSDPVKEGSQDADSS